SIPRQDFKAGTYITQGYYKSFQRTELNKKWLLDDMEIQRLQPQADRHMRRLDLYSEYIPSIHIFISMHVANEATQSSKIEGTQTNIEDAFMDKEDLGFERRDDWVEVHNYIEAMNKAIQKLHDLPFSSRLIRDTHRILLQSAR